MSAELFIDSSAWLPLMESRDPNHKAIAGAVREQQKRGIRPLTSNLVVAETHALLLRRAHRALAMAFLHEVRRPPMLVAVSDAELEARAQHDWLERFSDHDFSFTDAVSFALMTERGIDRALALDKHFATAGFTLVP